MKIVQFKQYRCAVIYKKYQNGRDAITLMGTGSYAGETIAVATVNLPDEPLGGPYEVAIKDYSENEGMLDALMEAGVVSAPKRFVRSGWVNIPICDMLD